MAGLTSTRFAVWSGLQNSLSDIVAADGYWFDVSMNDDPPHAEDTITGAHLVMSMGQEVFTTVSHGNLYTSELEIQIDGYFQKMSTRDYVQDACRLSQDIRRAAVKVFDSLARTIDSVHSLRLGSGDGDDGWIFRDDGHIKITERVVVTFKTKDDW